MLAAVIRFSVRHAGLTVALAFALLVDAIRAVSEVRK